MQTYLSKAFVASLCELIDASFFKLPTTLGCFQSESFEQSIKAAYDLRSKYVHTGAPFGHWIKPSNDCADLQIGEPVVDEKDFRKILARAPKFNGLERIIRYCILELMSRNGFDELKTLATMPNGVVKKDPQHSVL